MNSHVLHVQMWYLFGCEHWPLWSLLFVTWVLQSDGLWDETVVEPGGSGPQTAVPPARGQQSEQSILRLWVVPCETFVLEGSLNYLLLKLLPVCICAASSPNWGAAGRDGFSVECSEDRRWEVWWFQPVFKMSKFTENWRQRVKIWLAWILKLKHDENKNSDIEAPD